MPRLAASSANCNVLAFLSWAKASAFFLYIEFNLLMFCSWVFLLSLDWSSVKSKFLASDSSSVWFCSTFKYSTFSSELNPSIISLFLALLLSNSAFFNAIFSFIWLLSTPVFNFCNSAISLESLRFCFCCKGDIILSASKAFCLPLSSPVTVTPPPKAADIKKVSKTLVRAALPSKLPSWS